MNACKWTRFYKVSPGGNTTILLDSSQVHPLGRAEAANKLMNSLSLGGEQVGFIGWPGSEGAGEFPSLSMLEEGFALTRFGPMPPCLPLRRGRRPGGAVLPAAE